MGDAKPHEEEDWYCSKACSESTGYVYFLCKTKRHGERMVQCVLQSQCKKLEWYHMKCIGVERKILPDKWYCSEAWVLGAENDDHILNHSKSLLWEGINLLVRRDSVREGDGIRIVSHWKMDMIQFWSRNHSKYFISGVHFLAGVGGFLSQRLRLDLTWNRLTNVKGVPGGNIGLDLLNEFMNNDFKEMLKHCHGRYTETHIQRVSEMSGAFGQKIDKLFTEAALGDLQTSHYESKKDWFKTDAAKFVEEFQPDALFDHCPVRSHKCFEEFMHSHSLPAPESMGRKIGAWASQMDFWKSVQDVFSRCTE